MYPIGGVLYLEPSNECLFSDQVRIPYTHHNKYYKTEAWYYPTPLHFRSNPHPPESLQIPTTCHTGAQCTRIQVLSRISQLLRRGLGREDASWGQVLTRISQLLGRGFGREGTSLIGIPAPHLMSQISKRNDANCQTKDRHRRKWCPISGCRTGPQGRLAWHIKVYHPSISGKLRRHLTRTAAKVKKPAAIITRPEGTPTLPTLLAGWLERTHLHGKHTCMCNKSAAPAAFNGFHQITQ